MVLDSQPTADVTIGLSSQRRDRRHGLPGQPDLHGRQLERGPDRDRHRRGRRRGRRRYRLHDRDRRRGQQRDPNYNGLNAADVAVTNTDNDTAGITVSRDQRPTRREAGGTATFTVVLTSQPTADVTIGISSSDPTEGTVSTGSLTFTAANWNVRADRDRHRRGRRVRRRRRGVHDRHGAGDQHRSELQRLERRGCGGGQPRQRAAELCPRADAAGRRCRLPGKRPTRGCRRRGAGDRCRRPRFRRRDPYRQSGQRRHAADRLAFRPTGSGPGQVGVSGNTLSYSGVAIGTWTGGTNGTPLVATFNAQADAAAVQAIVRSVTFENTSDAPTVTPRTVRFVLTDGDGGTSNAATQTVTVAELNDAPTISAPGPQTTAEDTPLVFAATANNRISIADPDAGAGLVQLTASVTSGTLTLNGTTGLTFITGDGVADAALQFRGTLANVNAALNGLRYTPPANASGLADLVLNVDDLGQSGSGGSLTASATVGLTVTP